VKVLNERFLSKTKMERFLYFEPVILLRGLTLA